MDNKPLFTYCLTLLLLCSHAVAYRPVIIFHGILASSDSMKDQVKLIKDSHNGTVVYDIDGYDEEFSIVPMWKQVEGIKKKMLPIFQNATDGVHLICFSQGGLVCRGILETTPNHNVHSFISLSSPQAGQFGDTVYANFFFPNYTKDHLYEILYTPIGQEISVGNYWRDPHHMDLYEKSSQFLYPLNYPNPSSTYKTNFEQIKDLVLIGGPDDGVITPWQSSHFAFYDDKEAIVEMESQEYYVKDTFGLQTINSKGGIHIYARSGVHHRKWHGNKSVFDDFIAPHLD